MRAASMRPVDGPASTDTLAANGGLDVPGREPASTTAVAAELDTVSPVPEIIPGAYEPNTAMHREPGGFGGHFNGDDAVSPDADAMMSADVRDEHRLEGGGRKK